MHLSKFIECTTPRVNPNVHHGLGMIMMCHCGLINCNVSTTLVGMLIMGEAMHMVGSEGVWEISVPSSGFSCEPITSLKKIKSLKKMARAHLAREHQSSQRWIVSQAVWKSVGVSGVARKYFKN